MDADQIPTYDQVERPVEMWPEMAVASLDRAIASAGRSLCLLEGLLTQLEQSPNGSGEA